MEPQPRRVDPKTILLNLSTDLKGGPWTNERGVCVDPRIFWQFRKLPLEAGVFTDENRQFAEGVVLPLRTEPFTDEEVRRLAASVSGYVQRDNLELESQPLCPVLGHEPLLLLAGGDDPV